MLVGEDDIMSDFRKPAVLAVDDDPGMRGLISTVMEGAGFVVYQAEDSLAALAILGRLLPDAIISDLNMPRMSGYDRVPVVAVASLKFRWLCSREQSSPRRCL